MNFCVTLDLLRIVAFSTFDRWKHPLKHEKSRNSCFPNKPCFLPNWRFLPVYWTLLPYCLAQCWSEMTRPCWLAQCFGQEITDFTRFWCFSGVLWPVSFGTLVTGSGLVQNRSKPGQKMTENLLLFDEFREFSWFWHFSSIFGVFRHFRFDSFVSINSEFRCFWWFLDIETEGSKSGRKSAKSGHPLL